MHTQLKNKEHRWSNKIIAATVVLDAGTQVTTDSEGRFHLPDLDAGPRALKLDLARLGMPATPTTDVTQVVNVSPGLIATAQSHGLTVLGEELRLIEAGDPEGHEFPRFKKSDDATALLLRVTE